MKIITRIIIKNFILLFLIIFLDEIGIKITYITIICYTFLLKNKMSPKYIYLNSLNKYTVS